MTRTIHNLPKLPRALQARINSPAISSYCTFPEWCAMQAKKGNAIPDSTSFASLASLRDSNGILPSKIYCSKTGHQVGERHLSQFIDLAQSPFPIALQFAISSHWLSTDSDSLDSLYSADPIGFLCYAVGIFTRAWCKDYSFEKGWKSHEAFLHHSESIVHLNSFWHSRIESLGADALNECKAIGTFFRDVLSIKSPATCNAGFRHLGIVTPAQLAHDSSIEWFLNHGRFWLADFHLASKQFEIASLRINATDAEQFARRHGNGNSAMLGMKANRTFGKTKNKDSRYAQCLDDLDCFFTDDELNPKDEETLLDEATQKMLEILEMKKHAILARKANMTAVAKATETNQAGQPAKKSLLEILRERKAQNAKQ